ncbi:phage tail sheath C-terminal domain-containing protein [Bradyrhizobium sp.]|uniref:phage tail sheath C-terminal domain-containing protein n=1 Tax=Bradyrhizobium sp. TaxID=376 RepID=UPI003C464464
MSALTYPGVYIEELPSGVHTITGVATSIAAFIGSAPQGTTTEAVLVQSWSDYQSQFGGLSAGNYLGYAVNQFFSNGGQQAYIIRLVGKACTAASSSANPIGGSLLLYAASPGAWGNNLQIAVTTQPGNSARFSLQVIDGASGKVLESYANLSVAANDAQYVVTVINSDSQNVTFVNPTQQTSAAPSAPPNSNTVPGPVLLSPLATQATGGTLAAGQYFYQVSALYGNLESVPSNELSVTTTGTTSSNTISWSAAPNYQNQAPTGYRIYRGTAAGKESGYYSPGNVKTFADTGAAALTAGVPVAMQLSGGQDGTILQPNDGNFEPAALTGVLLLDRVPIFNLLCVPGESDAATIQSLQAYCNGKRAFYIVDSPQNVQTSYLMTNGPSAITSNALNPNSNLAGQYSINSAYYFPWVSAPDPLFGNRPALFPPCGFVAGIYAATDANFGVWKAPAGIDASLTGISGLQYTLTDLENGALNIQAVNCLRQFRVYGDVVWGARTLQGNDQIGSQWKYVPIRRLALFIESSLYDGTQWVVFEPNDERLWGQIRLNVGVFMQGLFLQGAFQGTTPSQAYFVKCDDENNPQSSIDQGIVNVLVGFAPLYPAEFVVIEIQQMAGQLQS